MADSATALVHTSELLTVLRNGAMIGLHRTSHRQACGQQAHRQPCQALGQKRNRRAVEPLAEALKDEDGAVCVAALNALGQIGGEQAMKALVMALLNDMPAVEAIESLARREPELARTHALEPVASGQEVCIYGYPGGHSDPAQRP